MAMAIRVAVTVGQGHYLRGLVLEALCVEFMDEGPEHGSGVRLQKGKAAGERMLWIASDGRRFVNL